MPKFLKEITFSGQSTPAIPDPGYGSVYIDGLTNLLYYINDVGNTYDLTSGGTGSTYVTGFTYNNANILTIKQNNGQSDLSVLINTVTGLTSNGTISSNTISATTYQNLPIDVYITGGTYSAGTATFTNITGGTFDVTGFTTGGTSLYWYAENATPPAVGPIATGPSAIAIGSDAQALDQNMYSFGDCAGYNAIEAAYSTFIGFESGYEGFLSSGSVFLGQRSGKFAQEAANSVFIGTSSGQYASSSRCSNFIGCNSGYFATETNNSNFIGTQSGYVLEKTFNSNFIGFQTGRFACNLENSNFIGTRAGDASDKSSYSTFIGYQAGLAFTNNKVGSNNIIIGTNITLPNATSNSLNIGGILFGNGLQSDNSSVTPFTGVTTSANIGIGVINPTNTLHISGITNPLRIQGLITSANTNYLVANSDGVVTLTTGATGTDIFVTGFTYNNANTLTIRQNNAQPDLTASINTMTGLTIIGNLSATTIDAEYIDFTPLTARPTHSEARVYWYDDEKTLELQTENSGFNIEVGHQTVVRVRNTTGGPLTKGSLVYINGGSGNNPTVSLASYEADSDSARTLGFLGINIPNNQFGYAITNGMVRDVNTSAYSAGTQLYLFTGGTYTNIRPVAPLHEVRVGIVVRQSATVGIIFTAIMNGYELDELHNVRISGETNNDLLQYNSSISAWTNTQSIRITSLTANTISATTYQNLPYGVADINNQTLTAYTFSISDYGDLVTFSSSTFVRATVPTNLSVPFPIGTQIMLSQFGTGQLRVTGDTGVTLYSYGNAYNLVGQYSTAFLTKQATDTWILDGNLTTLNL